MTRAPFASSRDVAPPAPHVRAARRYGALVCLTWIMAACQSAPEPVRDAPAPMVPAQAAPAPPEPPPFIPPAPPGSDLWVMPALGAADPYFPFLPGEDARRTRSIGDVVNGYLINARP